MKLFSGFSRQINAGLATIILLGSTAVTAPAAAQDNNLEGRIDRLESEVRAVQRKVFPGGSQRFFEPEIQAETPAQPNSASNASPVLADMLARVDALEAQLAGLTSRSEENTFRMGQLEKRLQAVEAAEKTRADAGSASAAASSSANAAQPLPAAGASPEPSAERIAAVSAIIKPETGDAGEDNYVYGFRLWDAGFYPEAQQQLQLTVDQYSNHSRISHARNLLGRAFLDDDKPKSAAKILLENYQKNPRGERAPDSLYFLGAALIAAKDNEKACAAFDELADAYPESASGRLSSRLQSSRSQAGCN